MIALVLAGVLTGAVGGPVTIKLRPRTSTEAVQLITLSKRDLYRRIAKAVDVATGFKTELDERDGELTDEKAETERLRAVLEQSPPPEAGSTAWVPWAIGGGIAVGAVLGGILGWRLHRCPG